MTTIIGVQGDGFCVIGVDSRISTFEDSGYASQIMTLREGTTKVANNGKYLVGVAGDVRQSIFCTMSSSLLSLQ